jgi:RNA polymerase sigma-70 factor (ECF subfamily)
METNVEILWDQFHTRLRRFIASRLPDDDDADDILQDVFVRIHTNLERVRDVDKLESWVYQIARNSIIDYYRSRRPGASLPELPVEDEHPEPDAAESMAPYLREIVQSLPEPYREALLLTDYQGLSQKELAERLGISFPGAKSRVQRARQKVRDILLACCHFEFDVRGMVCCYRERCCGCLGEPIPL